MPLAGNAATSMYGSVVASPFSFDEIDMKHWG